MRPHELTLLCAPTGTGKTALLASISAQLIRMGIPHFAAPIETGDVDFGARVISALLGQELNHADAVPKKELDANHIELQPYLDSEKLYISTYDNRVDVDDMIAHLSYMNKEKKCEVALLDNLNFFLRITSAQMEKAEMDTAIHEFVMAAKALPMHIILIVHPRKTLNGRVESEFDIKGSSTAVQEAANVVLFNRPKEEDVKSNLRTWFDREMVFKKIRKRGQYVNQPFWLTYVNGRYVEKGVFTNENKRRTERN